MNIVVNDYLTLCIIKQIRYLFVFIPKLFMFASILKSDKRMNHLAFNIASRFSQLMGCNDSMMSMSMIMR